MVKAFKYYTIKSSNIDEIGIYVVLLNPFEIGY